RDQEDGVALLERLRELAPLLLERRVREELVDLRLERLHVLAVRRRRVLERLGGLADGFLETAEALVHLVVGFALAGLPPRFGLVPLFLEPLLLELDAAAQAVGALALLLGVDADLGDRGDELGRPRVLLLQELLGPLDDGRVEPEALRDGEGVG